MQLGRKEKGLDHQDLNIYLVQAAQNLMKGNKMDGKFALQKLQYTSLIGNVIQMAIKLISKIWSFKKASRPV